jgi:23S rRNA pseudouridine1911/1915/1917 synthase
LVSQFSFDFQCQHHNITVDWMLVVKKLLVDRTPRTALRLIEQEFQAQRLFVLTPLRSESSSNAVSGHGVFMASESLTRHLQTLEVTQRAAACEELNAFVKSTEHSRLVPPPLHDHIAVLAPEQPYVVRNSLPWVVAELRRRAHRFLGIQCGRCIADEGMDAVERRMESLLSTPVSEVEAFDHAVYHGMILSLCETDPAMAQAMSLNSSLPPLNATVAVALARTATVEGPDLNRLAELASAFSSRDEGVPSWGTVATALALRARKIHWDTSLPREVRSAALASLKSLTSSFRVDPTVVFASNVVSIQEWSVSQCSGGASAHPEERVLQKLIQLQASLKSTTANAIGNIVMSDVERPWLSHIVAQREHDEGAWRSSLPTILEDPKRWLVDSRQLKAYAELLADGQISCHHPSFPAFLDECGECYLGEQPQIIRFSLQDTRAATNGVFPDLSKQEAHAALLSLAPASAFWMTLLKQSFDSVTMVKSCDGLAWLVEVKLPAVHEATQHTCGVSLPDVVFEDQDVVAFNKPAGLPVSRHALCCSQRSGAALTDLSSVLLKSDRFPMYKPGSGIFRGGQLHRLDLDTTGVLLYAKTEHAMRSLRHQIGTSAEYGSYPKCYTALCRVLESDLSAIKMAGVVNDSHDSRVTTRYSVLQFFKSSRVALVECRIQQGKKHQIRRHLASIGMPILQDVEYGGAACTTPLMDRIALHASGITIVHPTRRKPMHISAALPADMSEALRTLHNSRK